MKETKILYRGISLTGSFSPETLEWLEEYNSLPEELQEFVNFEPEELTRAMMQYNNMLTRNTPDTVYDAGQYISTGGLEFDPNFWNSADKIKRANCYAHAMNVTVQNEGEKLQPGEIRKVTIDYKENLYRVATRLIQEAIQDAASQNLGRIINMRVCEENERPQHNEYKVAFVVAPLRKDPNKFFDYHWYRENYNGVWSHKPGSTQALISDASGQTIDANNMPKGCNRNYRSLNYSIFWNYYMVTYS